MPFLINSNPERSTFDLSPHRKHYPFKSHWWDRDGLDFHYLDEGEGEPLLMLHGNPTWSFYYRNLVKAFRKDYRVIVPDHIGCGPSSKPSDDEYDYRMESRVVDIERFLEHLGIDRNITLIAHDWGGIIGSAVAARNPDLFSRLVLMNTAAFRMPEGKKLPWQLWYAKNIPIIPAIQIRGLNAFSLLATYTGVQKKMDPEIRKAFTAPYDSWKNRIATHRFVQDIPLKQSEPSYEVLKLTDQNLHRLKGKPMLIIWGERDFIFDMEILNIWRSRFPDAEVHTIPDAHHYVLEDAPDEIIERIGRFLRSNPISDRGRV